MFIQSILFISASALSMLITDASTLIWTASALGIVQSAVIILCSKRRNPLDVFTLAMLLWAAQFPVSALLLHLFSLPLLYGISPANLGEAVLVANLAQEIVAVMWTLPLWAKVAMRAPRPRLPQVTEVGYIYELIWVLSVVARLYLSLSGYQAGFDIDAGTLDVGTNLIYIASGILQVLPIAAFCVVLQKRGRWYKLVAWSIVAIEVVFITVFAGTKSGPVILLVSFAAAYHYAVRPTNTRVMWAALSIMAIAVVPFYALKARVPSAVVSEYLRDSSRSALGIGEYGALYKNAAAEIVDLGAWSMFRDTSSDLVYRVDMVSTLAATMSHYKQAPYDTEMYLLQWIKPYVPRFLWPEKGWVGLGIFVTGDILHVTSYTHAAVNSTIEGVIAFGAIGVLILSILHGAAMGFTIEYLLNRKACGDSSLWRVVFAALYLIILYFNQSFAFPRTIVTYVILFWVVSVVGRVARSRSQVFVRNAGILRKQE